MSAYDFGGRGAAHVSLRFWWEGSYPCTNLMVIDAAAIFHAADILVNDVNRQNNCMHEKNIL